MNLKKLVGIGLVLALMTSSVGCGWGSKKSADPEVVAKVNGEIITGAELEARLQQAGAYHQGLTGEEGQKVFAQMRETHLERLINEKIFLQGALRENLTATQEEIEARLTNMKNQTSGDDWEAALKQQNLTEDILKAKLANAIILDKFAAQLTQGIEATPEEAKAYYDKNILDFVDKPAATKVRMIVCDDETKANEAMQALSNGRPFAEVAQEYSIDETNKAKGGDLGWIGSGMVIPEIEVLLPKTEVGQNTGLVKAGERFFIAYVEDRRTISFKPYEEVKGAALQSALEAKQTAVLQEWLNAERAKAQIEKF